MAALPVPAGMAELQEPRRAEQPRHSRLYASLGTAASPEEIRQRFAPFGEVVDVWVMRDRPCEGKPAVAAYVKYALASQACRAAEELEGRHFSPEAPRPMKVFISQRQPTGSTRNIGIRQLTLIRVSVPNSFTEKHLTNTFEIYGTIDVCMILQKENQEVAYIRFLKASQAALAIEQCDKKFKAVWADGETTFTETYKEKKESSEVQRSNFSSLGYNTAGPELVNMSLECHEEEYSEGSMGYRTPLSESVTKPHESSVHYSFVSNTEQEAKCHRTEKTSTFTSAEPPNLACVVRRNTRSPESVSRHLWVVSEFPFAQQQLFDLFNIIPGLESCEVTRGLYSNRAYAVVQYNNAASAIYAKHKLNGFEYPFGSWLLVSFTEEGTEKLDLLKRRVKKIPSAFQRLELSEVQSSSPHLQTDAQLPSTKRKAPPDSSEQERLFIVFNPHPLSQNILENVLCRFGHFIDVCIIPGENKAYGMFAERASANNAIAILHDKTVNGVKLKVKLAAKHLDSSEVQSSSPHLQTDAQLPSNKRKAPPDSSEKERLFIMFDPHPLRQDILENVLCRFGNFIKIYLFPEENKAYAMFAERASASNAKASLHDKTVNGVKLKVILAARRLESSEVQGSSPYLQTDAQLPSKKRKAPLDSSVQERIFIAFSPHPLPQDILENVLCRFGNFINVYIIPGETIAYAVFADRASASNAKAILHDKTVNGVKLQVKLAAKRLESSETQSSSPHLQTDAQLPSTKRKASPDSSVQERLFIVFSPHPLRQDILENVLCRFGNFINVYVIPGENIAYAMFADGASASNARAILHDKTVNGVKLQVKLAAKRLESSEVQSSSPYLHTDAQLPSAKRKAPPDSSEQERLFIMFDPHPLPQAILDSVLCRFGNFINVYLIPGENKAYAMFAKRGSASNAIAILHDKTVNGVKLKVKLTDLPIEDSSKRQRTF